MLPWPAVAASDHAAWSLIGRLGEAQLLLPAALAFAWWLARRSEARPLVQWWLSLMALAALVTTTSRFELGPRLGAAWANTMPVDLDVTVRPELVCERLLGLSIREMPEPEGFKHFFGTTKR